MNFVKSKLNIFRKRKRAHGQRTTRLLNGKETSFAVREAYKTARTNLMFSLPNTAKAVVVTSSNPAEGKTTTCINFGITFAETGAKVLLIDADLRKPRLSKIFEIKDDLGFTNAVRGFCEVDEAIHETQYENLYVLPSGHVPPNPAELMSSQESKRIISELCEQYDYVFIDTPPINVVTDATLVANFVAGTVLIVRQNITSHSAVDESIMKLNFANANILGFILNDVQPEKKPYYYYRYGKKYSQYYYYDKNKYYEYSTRYEEEHSPGKNSDDELDLDNIPIEEGFDNSKKKKKR